MNHQPVKQHDNERPSDQGRLSDGLWSLGLVLTVGALIVAALGGAGLSARVTAILAFALSGVALYLTHKQTRQIAGPAALVLAVSLFSAVVAGRQEPVPTWMLADGAPRYQQGEGSSLASVHLHHPGPVALSQFQLAAVAPGRLEVGSLMAAEWDGAWYAARVTEMMGSNVRVHFEGWESAFDRVLPLSGLRGLNEDQLTSLQSARSEQPFASKIASPAALRISVFQAPSSLNPGAELGKLEPDAKLFAPRLDAAELPIVTALPDLAKGKPFSLLAQGAFRVDSSGPHYFAVSADGPASLWVDDELVSGDAPLSLAEGVHDLRLEYRHQKGPTMTLRLTTGTDPNALLPLDLTRQGVAQVVHEEDGAQRIVLAEGVLFDFDQDVLKASSERALRAIFDSSLVTSPQAFVRVEGHTDDQGSDAHNMALSQRRAERVKAWLVERGRKERTVSTKALGETRPRVPNDTPEHRKANRRVELVLLLSADATAEVGDLPSEGGESPGGPVVSLLESYYRDLNDGTFDANRYFEPNVDRYITMRGTTTTAMNNYMQNLFPKQFKEPHFEYEPGSLEQEGPSTYVFVERSKYILAGKTTPVEKRYQVRIRLSPNGKMVFLHQFKKLSL